jgi:septal ring factor EnvC (AmiA/AmiB activator)
MLENNNEVEIIYQEVRKTFFLCLVAMRHTYMFINTVSKIVVSFDTLQLTQVIKMVTNITERLGRQQTHEYADKMTKDALQDRIVFLEAEATRLREENKSLRVDNAKHTSKIDDVTSFNRLQALEIEKLIDERDEALARLEKVESLFKQVFHSEKVMYRSKLWPRMLIISSLGVAANNDACFNTGSEMGFVERYRRQG